MREDLVSHFGVKEKVVHFRKSVFFRLLFWQITENGKGCRTLIKSDDKKFWLKITRILNKFLRNGTIVLS